jgi:AcrR family transcriptional regulator
MPGSTDPTALPTTAQGPRSGGRPTKAETWQLSDDIRQAALALFLERGYEGTSLEDIARAAGTTKPSLYVRFRDKQSLFTGVMHWAIGRADWPEPESPPPDLDDLEGALRSIADAAVRRATNPSMVSLTRIVVAQAARFPDLAQRALAASWNRQSLIADLLRRHAANGVIVADEPEILTEHFLALVTGTPARLASFGVVRDAATQEHHTSVAIELFLRGLRPG